MRLVTQRKVNITTYEKLHREIEVVNFATEEAENLLLGSLHQVELEKFAQSLPHSLSDGLLIKGMLSLSDHSLKLMALIVPSAAGAIHSIRISRIRAQKTTPRIETGEERTGIREGCEVDKEGCMPGSKGSDVPIIQRKRRRI